MDSLVEVTTAAWPKASERSDEWIRSRREAVERRAFDHGTYRSDALGCDEWQQDLAEVQGIIDEMYHRFIRYVARWDTSAHSSFDKRLLRLMTHEIMAVSSHSFVLRGDYLGVEQIVEMSARGDFDEDAIKNANDFICDWIFDKDYRRHIKDAVEKRMAEERAQAEEARESDFRSLPPEAFELSAHSDIPF